MRELRRVYEALSKIYSEDKEELSSEKVELSLASDAADQARYAAVRSRRIDDFLKERGRQKAKLLNEAESIVKENKALRSRIEQEAKRLGFDPKDLPPYQDLISETGNLELWIKRANR